MSGARWEGATFVHRDPRTGSGSCIAEWGGNRIFVPGSVMRAGGVAGVNQGDRVAVVTVAAGSGLIAEAIRLVAPAEGATDA